jgi:hypothetical protein
MTAQIPRHTFRVASLAGGARLDEYHGPVMGWLPRAQLRDEVWAIVGPALERTLVAQRKAAGLPRGRWRLPYTLGWPESREVLLLFWGAEQATLEQLPAVIANWRGFAPEERWWLVTSVEATRGMAGYAPDRGWRRAIYHILVENPVC